MKLLPVLTLISSAKLLYSSPIESNVCNRPLNVLLLGYFGAGKSTIANVLHGLYDLDPDDDREIAKTGDSFDTVTRKCTGYDSALGDTKLHVVDTPGFEDHETKNDKVSSLITDQVPKLLKDGFDAFFFLYRVERAFPTHINNVLNFITSLITKEGFRRGFIVFTKADGVQMTEEKEEMKIEELKRKFLEVSPQSKELMESVKYLFYRHTIGHSKEGRIYYPEIRSLFASQAYSEIKKICVENRGKTFSTKAMIEAKVAYENLKQKIDFYQKARNILTFNYTSITAKNKTLPSDLSAKLSSIKKIGLKNFETNTTVMTQEEQLNKEIKFDEENKGVSNAIKDFIFLENEQDKMAKNISSLQAESQSLLTNYTQAKTNFTNAVNLCKSAQAIDNYDSLVSIVSDNKYNHEIKIGLQIVQRIYDEAVPHFKNLMIKESGIESDNFVVPGLTVVNPTFNDYKKYAETIKSFNDKLSKRITKLSKEAERVKYEMFSVSQYSEKNQEINEIVVPQKMDFKMQINMRMFMACSPIFVCQ
ncbi:hypothetical protein O9G_004404 [Rozella allomycis CSF55]|uniref:AIG1-type G domain-containing protein n=1 Tax=Rozella allomycis (strain CSF55) TaxID=988480 RepID=A0A075AQH0_ROZAC|nr:hypothetical protein O9G_004404 [Rozella allomycis CSF55]|eukprot:EPZ32496.1 hypothetical protein O9G_004404 [Rozella allomycis CSF55]